MALKEGGISELNNIIKKIININNKNSRALLEQCHFSLQDGIQYTKFQKKIEEIKEWLKKNFLQ